MSTRCAKKVVPPVAAIVCALALLGGTGMLRAHGGQPETQPRSMAKITVDYPLEGSIFPPEITPPTFLFRDGSEAAKRWVVEASFGGHENSLRREIPGEHFKWGAVDPETGPTGELLKLNAQQTATRTWTPDADTWATIKKDSVKAPATITIAGFADDAMKQPVSGGSVTISTSADPVGAPIFYRDVPLMLWPRSEKGAIQPLPPFAVPLIKWKLRDISQPQSRVVMEKLVTCANCHSFSMDGKTMGLDLDGPKNDKGLYAIVPVSKQMTINNSDVVRWSSFQEDPNARVSPSVKRFGFMSQISPDGRYVITSIGPPGLGNKHQDELPEFAAGIADRLYSMNFKGPPFNQVFYPTRGILAWYDRQEGKLKPLPGADDPKYVHTSAFWSPDGKYLIFSRALARESYPEGEPKAEYANDPNETQIQYDLYKIPFNGGLGGKAEPVLGASNNGMSNNFPKVSPDGRWIVFVENKNGLLMRPDSHLYIVPFNGGNARLMKCNTSLMNSWHTFSPNGRWLAFSSKGRSPFTQLMLTHIDADGNDSPAILVDNMTAANRAVNIPEFVNISPDGLQHINPEATEFYRLFNLAFDQMEKKQTTEAIATFHQVVQHDPNDPIARYALATALTQNNQENLAVEEYRKACTFNTNPPSAWYDHLAVSQANTGDPTGAIQSWKKALAIDPSDAGAQMDLGSVLFSQGQPLEGEEHLRKAVQLAPVFAEAHYRLGFELAKTGRMDEAVDELGQAVTLRPDSVEYRVNLGYALGVSGKVSAALTEFQKAVELSGGKDWRSLDMLATAYNKIGRPADAIQAERQAIDLARQQNDLALQKHLEANLERFEQENKGAVVQ
jgi:Flp pilus assembly protein TadD